MGNIPEYTDFEKAADREAKVKAFLGRLGVDATLAAIRVNVIFNETATGEKFTNDFMNDTVSEVVSSQVGTLKNQVIAKLEQDTEDAAALAKTKLAEEIINIDVIKDQ
jgi:pimeloyl-CoA synthetase